MNIGKGTHRAISVEEIATLIGTLELSRFGGDRIKTLDALRAADGFDIKTAEKAIATGTLVTDVEPKLTRAMVLTHLLVPVLTVESAPSFLTEYPDLKSSVVIDGRSFMTAPLEMGQEVNLLAISKPSTVEPKREYIPGEKLRKTAKVTTLFIKVGEDIFGFNLGPLAMSDFPISGEGESQMSCIGNCIMFDRSTPTIMATWPAWLQKANELGISIVMGVAIKGTLNVGTATITEMRGDIAPSIIENTTDLGIIQELRDILSYAKIIGYNMVFVQEKKTFDFGPALEG